MRVIDCDECGETLSAANDAELATQVTDHFQDRHDRELEEDEADAMVADQAYDAADA
jgi:predicted small metal-binding protein